MPHLLNVACLQTRPMPDFDTALAEAMPMAEQAVAAGARLICLPEYCGGLKTDNGSLIPPAAPEPNHPVLFALRNFASAHAVWVLVGSVAVPAPDGKILNRSVMIGPDGIVKSRYDKIHLFDIQLSRTEVFRESAHVVAGEQATSVDTPWGKLGHSICYDVRFPQLYRDLAQTGCTMLAVPAAFTKKTGEAHWHMLNRARAIENGAFVVAPCAIGPIPGGGESYGHSLIVGPWGEVLADGGLSTGSVHATIDLDEVEKARQRIPSLSHDRPFSLPGEPRSAT